MMDLFFESLVRLGKNKKGEEFFWCPDTTGIIKFNGTDFVDMNVAGANDLKSATEYCRREYCMEVDYA